MFYIASLGFQIVPGGFWINTTDGRMRLTYTSEREGIRLKKEDGEEMLLPFRAAMALVSQPISPAASRKGHGRVGTA